MFKTSRIFTQKRFLQCKIPQVKVFLILCSQSFERHQFILSDMVQNDAMCYWTLGLANITCNVSI